MARLKRGLFKNHGSLGFRLKVTSTVDGRSFPLKEYPGYKNTEKGRKECGEFKDKIRAAIAAGELTAETYHEFFPGSPNIKKLEVAGVKLARKEADPTIPTVARFVREFVGGLEQRKRPLNTIIDYKSRLRTAGLWPKGDGAPVDSLAELLVTAVDVRTVDLFIGRLIERKISADRIRRIRKALARIFNKAAKYYRMENPFRSFGKIDTEIEDAGSELDGTADEEAVDETVADPFIAEECAALLAMDGEWEFDRDVFAIALDTGVRRGELFALRIEHVSLAKKQVKVRYSLDQHGTIKKPKTKRSKRTINFGSIGQEAFRRRLLQVQFTSPWVFPSPIDLKKPRDMSCYFRPSNCHRPRGSEGRWGRFLEAAGVRYRPMGQVRHTYGVAMYQAIFQKGLDPRYVCDQMGHRDLSMLEKHYVAWKPESLERPAQDVIADSLNEGGAACRPSEF